MNSFNIFHNGIANVIPNGEITITKFLELIKSDTPLFEKIRNCKEKDERNKLKSKLSYVTFAGTFEKRANEKLIKSSGLACLDYDDIENLEEVKEKLKSDEHTFCLFDSPSGKGVKLIVKIPEVKENQSYRNRWVSIARHFNITKADEATKDISRACYLSYDANPYFNPESKVYTKVSANILEKIKNAEKDVSRSGKEFGEMFKLIRKGLSKEEIFNEMRVFAKWECSPPQYKEITYNKAVKKIEQANEDTSEFLTYKGANKKTGKVEYSVNIDAVSDYLVSKYNFKTIYGEKTEKILVYDEKIFSKGARGIIKSECENLLKSYAKKNVVEEIFDKIKRKTKTTPEEFDKTDLYLIPLENGVYNLKTKRLQKHSPDNNFTFFSPVKFNVEAKCHSWFKFINETLYPEDVQTMKQWFGFNLFRQYFIKKAMLLLGKKDTGKTVCLDVMISFVGELNKCGLSLQKISSGSDFTKFALKGKLANIYDDLSSQDINDGGAFKIATGGGYISAEEKFGEFVQFKSYAKNTLAGNKAPPVKDNDDEAYFGRFMPIRFDNVPDKIDPFLRDKLQTEEELSGILNWALEGLHEILETGNFAFDKEDYEIKKIMEMSGDILIQFGEEVLEQSGGKISKEDMYNVYCLWANENEKPLLSKEQLGRRLNQKVKYLIAKNDAKQRNWVNVSLKNSWEEKFASMNKNQKLKGEDNPLHTFPNIICFKNNTLKKGNNNDVINNIYKVKKSVESVEKNEDKNNTLDTISDNQKIDELLEDFK